MTRHVLAAIALVLPPLALPAAERPNVLVIAVDDLRPQLGCYGDPTLKSPHIDRLATRGLLFQRAYCQQALCSPSRISLLSGRRPATSGIYSIGPTLRSRMPDVITLPQHFKNEGYFTRSLGKVYHVGIDDPASWSVPSWQSKKPRLGPVGREASARRIAEAKASRRKLPEKGKGGPFYASPAFEAVDCGDDDLLDGDCAREAVSVIRDLAKSPGRPFFLAVGFANPHVPWVAPRKYFDLYDPAQLNVPANNFPPKGAPPFAARTGADFTWYGGVPQGPLPDDYARECLRAYFAAASFIDAQVGRLLDALEETGLGKNTVVVFWGDHGYYMGEHAWWGGKHNNYEGATRVPLIVAVPGQLTAGRSTRGLVEFVDIYPSLVEICGLKPPADAAGLDGTSFAPLLRSPERPWKRAAFSQYPMGGNLGTAMRTERYRYVEWRKDKELVARELYDHANDAEENVNVVDRPEHAEVVAALAAQLKAGWKAALPDVNP